MSVAPISAEGHTNDQARTRCPTGDRGRSAAGTSVGAGGGVPRSRNERNHCRVREVATPMTTARPGDTGTPVATTATSNPDPSTHSAPAR